MDVTSDATSQPNSHAASPAAVMHGAGAATRLIIASSIGNAFEFYEILVYGYFAVIISKVFFPTADEAVSIWSRSVPSAFLFWRARSARFFLAPMAIARAAKHR